jgi:hypothetical protein
MTVRNKYKLTNWNIYIYNYGSSVLEEECHCLSPISVTHLQRVPIRLPFDFVKKNKCTIFSLVKCYEMSAMSYKSARSSTRSYDAKFTNSLERFKLHDFRQMQGKLLILLKGENFTWKTELLHRNLNRSRTTLDHPSFCDLFNPTNEPNKCKWSSGRVPSMTL